jgi:hypothetical protein
MIFNQVFIQPRAQRLNELIEENESQKKFLMQKSKSKQALPPLDHSKSKNAPIRPSSEFKAPS